MTNVKSGLATQKSNLVDFTVACISEFATRHSQAMPDAFSYLRKYQGIAFLRDFYDVEHTLSFDEIIDDLGVICRKNGGSLV